MKRILLIFLVISHFLIVFGNILAFFILPFYEKWYVSLPLMGFIFSISFSRSWKCPLTDFENKLRKDLDMKPIAGFVGHYIKKPLMKLIYIRHEDV